jgi:hypothetical protein
MKSLLVDTEYKTFVECILVIVVFLFASSLGFLARLVSFLGWFWIVMFGWLIAVVNCDQVV